MYRTLLLIPFLISLLTAQTAQPKVFHAQDTKHHDNYHTSSSIKNTQDRVISSSAEASAQITVVITIQATSEMTSGSEHDEATLSFLDNNRIQITEEIAKGEGEYLTTLLTMMKLKKEKKSLKNLQDNFENLIYLTHDDFLNKLKTLV